MTLWFLLIMSLSPFSRHQTHVRRNTWLILFLCLCVVLQMLGTPATLLSPMASADLVSGLGLEGLSLPQTPLDLNANSHSSISSYAPLTLYLPILLTFVFHPPLV
jgi:hypothetical protein